jgi:hypothetical protein
MAWVWRKVLRFWIRRATPSYTQRPLDHESCRPPMTKRIMLLFFQGGFRGRGRGRGGRGGGNFDGPPRGRGGRGGRGGYHGDYEQDPGGYYPPAPYHQAQGPAAAAAEPERKLNDCEIVCVSRNQRLYAERIEGRLRVLGLKVDVLFPNPKVDLAKILGNIASRGVMFAILVTPLNEDHSSVTLNILQGQQQEHRNMPLEDAVSLVAQLFEAGLEKPALGSSSGVRGSTSSKTGGGSAGIPGMPEDVRNVFGFLMDARPLSVMEYDKLIR